MSSQDPGADATTKALLKLAEIFKSLFMKNGGRHRVDLNQEEANDFYDRLGDITKEQGELLESIDPDKEPLKALAMEVRMDSIEAVRKQFNEENRQQLIERPLDFSPEAFVERVHEQIDERMKGIRNNENFAKVGSSTDALRQEIQDLNSIDSGILSKHLDPSKRHHLELINCINATTEHVAIMAQTIESPAVASGRTAEVKVDGVVVNPNNEPGQNNQKQHDQNKDHKGPSFSGL